MADTITIGKNTYDFSKVKVRKNGRVLDKFSLAYEYEQYDIWSNMTIIMDILSYQELKEKFRSLMMEKSNKQSA